MRILNLAAMLMLFAATAMAQSAKPLYENNFEQASLGKIAEEFLVLDGAFEVKQEGGNKFLELPGSPLETFGLLFGPTEKSDVVVSVRIRSTGQGRRYPTFGVGLNGQAGYKLQVSPAKQALELFKGDDSVASVAFTWKSGEWTNLRLQIRKAGDAWKVEGKAWQGTTEPAQSMLSYDEKTEPRSGRPSIWGMPFATTAIQYDDLLLKPLDAK